MSVEQQLPATREALPVVQEGAAQLPAVPLTADDLVRQQNLIHEAMRKVMKQGVDYGVIPGTQKPSLWQAGAEKLCNLFHLAPVYSVEREWLPELERHWEKRRHGRTVSGDTRGFIRFTVLCTLYVGAEADKRPIAGGTGTCNNFESKYVSQDPYTVEETILQMARKRAFVNATRTGTAASAIFSQDDDIVPAGDDSPAPRPAPSNTPKCPKCGKTLVVRSGKRGEFLACPGYPKCKHSQDLPDDVAGADVDTHDLGSDASGPLPETGTPPPAASPAAAKPSAFPRGWSPEKVLGGRSTYKGWPFGKTPDSYIKSLMEKASGVYRQAAEAEWARRQALNIHIDDPPNDPPETPSDDGAAQGADDAPQPTAPAVPPEAPPDDTGEFDPGILDGAVGAPGSAAREAAERKCPKCGHKLQPSQKEGFWLCAGCGMRHAASPLFDPPAPAPEADEPEPVPPADLGIDNDEPPF